MDFRLKEGPWPAGLTVSVHEEDADPRWQRSGIPGPTRCVAEMDPDPLAHGAVTFQGLEPGKRYVAVGHGATLFFETLPLEGDWDIPRLRPGRVVYEA